MGAALNSGRGGQRVKPDINVTPLVDVVLVLLIIFMLVIPNMQEGVPIELFKAQNAEQSAEQVEAITLSIARGDDEELAYFIDDVEYTREQLVVELARQHQAEPNQALLFRGDVRIDYEQIRAIFHECQNLGFASIRLAVGAQKDGWE